MTQTTSNGQEVQPVENPLVKFWKFINTEPDGHYFVQACLTVYLNVMLLLWGALVFDVATLNFGFLKWVLHAENPEVTDPLILIMLALTGGGIGGIIFNMQKLYKYSTRNKFKLVYAGDYIFRQFGSAALGGVIFALLASGLLSLEGMNNKSTETGASATAVPVISASTEAPIATESPVATDTPTEESIDADATQAETGTGNESTNEKPLSMPFDKKDGFYAFGIGFLAGFGNYQVMKKLDQVIKVIFGELTSDDLAKSKDDDDDTDTTTGTPATGNPA